MPGLAHQTGAPQAKQQSTQVQQPVMSMTQLTLRVHQIIAHTGGYDHEV
jgi:hypothetical protein